MRPRLITFLNPLNLAFEGAEVNPVLSQFARKATAMKRTSSPTISREMAAHIKFLVLVLKLYQHQAAALFGINQGRVSEIIRGSIFQDVMPARGPFPS